MIKETLRHEPAFGWVNASFSDPAQGQPCYLPDSTQIVRQRSNEGSALRRQGQPQKYQCGQCKKWVAENDAAMSKEGVMCLDCYTLSLQQEKEAGQDDRLSAARSIK
jgi:hypothetical protein